MYIYMLLYGQMYIKFLLFKNALYVCKTISPLCLSKLTKHKKNLVCTIAWSFKEKQNMDMGGRKVWIKCSWERERDRDRDRDRDRHRQTDRQTDSKKFQFLYCIENSTHIYFMPYKSNCMNWFRPYMKKMFVSSDNIIQFMDWFTKE